METHKGDARPTPGIPPTPNDAQSALGAVEQVATSMSRIAPPRWFFAVLAITIAPLGTVLALLPDAPAGLLLLVAYLAAWAAILWVTMHLVARQMGVVAWLSTEQMRPLAVILVPLVGVSIVLQTTVDPTWLPAASTVALGAGIFGFGLVHRRSVRIS